MNITRKSLPVLLTLHKLNSYFQKLYCFPSQSKLVSLLSKFTGLKISRRQLNYDLAAMVKGGLIRRIRRHRRTKHRGMEFRSTLYEITLKGYLLLFRAGVITWGIFAEIKNRIKEALERKQRPCATIGRKSDLMSLSDILGGLDIALN